MKCEIIQSLFSLFVELVVLEVIGVYAIMTSSIDTASPSVELRWARQNVTIYVQAIVKVSGGTSRNIRDPMTRNCLVYLREY
jgi:hypothetical protein